jgi:hypothetical protein
MLCFTRIKGQGAVNQKEDNNAEWENYSGPMVFAARPVNTR